MAGYYNKDSLKEQLDLENIYDLVAELGGEPEYVETGLISQTICHNYPGEGSRKLYYYQNSHLFKCFTDCDSTFDVFELVIKAMKIQKGYEWELYDAMVYIASYFGLGEAERPNQNNNSEQWVVFKRHDFSLPSLKQNPILKEYNPKILENFSYPRIFDWEQEGISHQVNLKNLIGYFPAGEQITIPHFDINNRLIGIRGRALIQENAERFGKYRPLQINNIIYSHPLSMNLYNLNNSKENIKASKTAIIFESEKSTLQLQTFYGFENNISVACCGSNISSYQIYLLEKLGVKEIIIAFDRQFKEIGDSEFQRLKNKLINLNRKYGNLIQITAIFDKNMITPYKSSPSDMGRDIFEKLLSERIIPK